MFSKEAQALAKPCYEAIKEIAGSIESKCNLCGGSGLRRAYIDSTVKKRCEDCKGRGKIKGKWEWEPRRGELVLRQPLGEVDLITRILVYGMLRLSSEDACLFFDKHTSGFIPILHWERIEEILKGMGYVLWLEDNEYRHEDRRFEAIIDSDDNTDIDSVVSVAKTRQLVVMRAVIELSKRR